MNKIFLAAVFTAMSFGVFAQKNSDSKFHFNAGPEIGFTTGDFSLTNSVGIGFSGQAEYNMPNFDNSLITFTAGYITYAGKSAGSGIKWKASNIIPLKVGAKYYLSKGFYGAGQIGVGIFNNNAGTSFAYTPMLGYEFKTKSNKAVDAAFKYDGYSSKGGSIGLRLAYRF